MGHREEFLNELRNRTTAHLTALSEESCRIFGEMSGLETIGTRIYRDITTRFGMDGAQEIGSELLALISGEMDDGAVAISERVYRGFRYLATDTREALPSELRETLTEIVTSLGHLDTP